MRKESHFTMLEYKTRYNYKNPFWTKQKQDIVITLYKNGRSAESLANELGIDHLAVLRFLHRVGVKIRPCGFCNRKYKRDDDFFKKIDTKEKAYILGYLYADGNVDHRGFSIAVAEQDKDILYKIKEQFKTDAPVRVNKRLIRTDRGIEQDMFPFRLNSVA